MCTGELGLVDINELLDPELKPSPNNDLEQQVLKRALEKARSKHPLSSGPEFINTDFTKPLFAEVHTLQRKMDLSASSNQTNTSTYNPANIQPLTNFTLAGGQGIMASQQQCQGQIAMTSNIAKSAFIPNASGIVNAPTQATLINVNPGLTGAAFIGQPIQVFGTGPYQQVVSTVPAHFMTQPGGAHNLANTVLMPIQQTNLLQQPGALQRAQLITAPPAFPKNIQPKPLSMIPMSTSVAHPSMNQWAKLVSNIGSIPSSMVSVSTAVAGQAIPQVSSVSLPINLQTTTQPSNLQSLQPRPAHMGSQILNVPRLPLTVRPPIAPEKVGPPQILASPIHQPHTIQQHPLQFLQPVLQSPICTTPQGLTTPTSLQPLQLTIQNPMIPPDGGTNVNHNNENRNVDQSVNSSIVPMDSEPISLVTTHSAKKHAANKSENLSMKPKPEKTGKHKEKSRSHQVKTEGDTVKAECWQAAIKPEFSETGQTVRSILDVRRERKANRKRVATTTSPVVSPVKKEKVKAESRQNETATTTIHYTKGKLNLHIFGCPIRVPNRMKS